MIRLANADQIRETAATFARAGAPQAPLFRAAAESRIVLVYACDPAASLPIDTMQRGRRPTVLLLGDDPPLGRSGAVGPDEWTGARRARYWQPRRSIVHGTGGRARDYDYAVWLAVQVQRLILVETSSAFAPAWRDWIAPFCPDGLMLLPNDGGSHPVAEAVH